MRNLLTAILVSGCVWRGDLGAQEEALGAVVGTVRLKVTPLPRPGKIPVDPQCAAILAGPLRSEETVTDATGNLKWVFLRITRGLEGREYPVPKEKVVLEQVGCCYTPHVFGIRVGQTLLIRNGDPILHNIHGLPFDNKEWNWAQSFKGQENEVRLLKPEAPFKIKCDVHTWMGSWAGVVDHPFFAVTDDTGRYSIRGLPPGKYTLSLWHEAWTTKAEKGDQQDFEVKAGETRTVDFALDKRKGD